MARVTNILNKRGDRWGELFIKTAASGLGLGYLPVAPGTFGTLLGIPICLLLNLGGPLFYVFAAVGLSLACVWVAARADRIYEVHDSSHIVVDEISGFVVTMVLIVPTLLTIGLGFVFFRLFDIFKPFPAGWCDKNLPGGWGVMLDDILAGVYANLSVRAVLFVKAMLSQGIR
jgi:phosphatidylglycerophosphatase A